MKKLLFLLVLIGPVILTELSAQNRFNTNRRNIKVVNNELIEYQKDGLINWTQGYLEGIGKMSTKIPYYEDAAMTIATSNLCALYDNIQIVDSMSLTMMGEKNEVFRQIIRVMKCNVQGTSISPAEIKNDTCYVRASIDFETLLLFKYKDSTLAEWIMAYYKPADNSKNNVVTANNTKEPVHSYSEFKQVTDSISKTIDNKAENIDSIQILNSEKKLGVYASEKSTPSMYQSTQNIYIRLNGKLYNPTPGFDYGKLVPVKWQPLVNLATTTLLGYTSENEKSPRWLKAIQMEDGSIVYDLDKVIARKEKWQKVGDFVLQLADVVIGLIK